MGDVNFQAPADAFRGLRNSAEPAGGAAWLYEHVYRTFLGPRIYYPRPASERSAFTHTEWDKWIAGEVWFPRIAVAHGVYPYKVFLTGSYPSGTTWAWYPHESNGSTIYYLRLYNAGMTAGTYSFRLTVRDQLFNSASVSISLTVYAANDAAILDHFRIYQQGSGGGGTGTAAAPFNDFAALWGDDYNNTAQCPPNAIVLLKGTATLTMPSISNEPNAALFHCGGNRPKQIVGAYGSAITFDLATSAKGWTVAAGADDWLMKNITLSGNPSTSLQTSNQIGQANFDKRCAFHDLTFYNYDAADPSNYNLGALGGDGSTYEKEYSSILGCTLDSIIASSAATNASGIMVMEVTSFLIDEITLTNFGTGGAQHPGYGVRFKHHSHTSEIRRVTALQGTQIASTASLGNYPISVGTGGGDLQHTDCVIRYCNVNAGAANRAIGVGAGNTASNAYSVRLYFNTCVGLIGLNGQTNVASTLHSYRNLTENAATNNGMGTVRSDWGAVSGEASVLEDNLNGSAGTLVDSSGVPLSSANYGYGHYLPAI